MKLTDVRRTCGISLTSYDQASSKATTTMEITADSNISSRQVNLNVFSVI